MQRRPKTPQVISTIESEKTMKTLKFVLLSTAAALFTAVPALADTVSYSLTTINPLVAPGGTVTFDGTISAPITNTGAIQLLGDSATSGAYTVDDTDFFVDTPFSLAPGESYNGPLFTVTLPSDASGTYTGFFDIDFADASSNTFFEDAQFNLTEAPAPPVPEPGTWVLLSTGMGAVGLLRRRFLHR